MRKSRFSEEQIRGILREAERTSAKAVCPQHTISAATYYGWKAKFRGMDVNEAPRLRALEDENRRIKNCVADQAALGLQRSTYYCNSMVSPERQKIERTIVGMSVDHRATAFGA